MMSPVLSKLVSTEFC